MLQWIETQVENGPNLVLAAGSAGIRIIAFAPFRAPDGAQRATAPVPIFTETVRQLEAYFRGELREFDLPLDIQGTDFQTRVWRQLLTIPYGQTRSYTQIAQAIGSANAVRAVGAANGANPIAIVVPCHRVIGASGKLVGYGGGLPLKKKLLALEGVIPASLEMAGPR
ncbi:MAG TPA: methylated-DNA--[protein]-cysteine S-methyltransferase [Bryobacteraceae bacterium]|nr:methylated-DNA--[protein]-cysteine S-methyltransferase [Bryobacteraceae bacterium]